MFRNSAALIAAMVIVGSLAMTGCSKCSQQPAPETPAAAPAEGAAAPAAPAEGAAAPAVPAEGAAAPTEGAAPAPEATPAAH